MTDSDGKVPAVRARSHERSLWPSSSMGRAAVTLGGAGAAALTVAGILTVSIQPGQGAVLGGFAVLAGAVLTFWNGKLTRDQTAVVEEDKIDVEGQKLAEQKDARDQLHLRETTRELRARFTTCSEQLGSESFAVRLAGVYAFAALADDYGAQSNVADMQVCVDVLCGYLRTPTNGHPESDASTSTTDDVKELEVRDTIVRVIGDHTRDIRRVGARTAEVLDGPWRRCDFNLTGAKLQHVEWNRCQFLGFLDLTGATITRRADFAHSTFERVSFAAARFLPEMERGHLVDFKNCTFVEGDFECTRFATSIGFAGARSRGQMRFAWAKFEGLKSDFSRMTFDPNSWTSFTMAKFKGTISFAAAVFDGPVLLDDANFDDVSRVSFHGPQRWTIPPTLPWSGGRDLPAFLDTAWPPPLASEVRAAAEAELRASAKAEEPSK